MARSGRFTRLVTFTVWPATLLILVSTLAVVIPTFYFYDELPSIPKPARRYGIDLDQAYSDLQTITSRPHPYNSHQNDLVHDYILSRLQNIAEKHDNIHVIDDVASNATFSQGSSATYYEGNNLLMRIEGTSGLSAILFSAHFDSVSTAPGATDDGMGVAALLQLAEYFAANRPKRDVVFNINNGEEDGLHGAHVFLEHPWAKLPSSFLNLEGAAGGGRPILFRSSSTKLTHSFSHVPHPHGNVVGQDALQRGVIKSGTDFSVYTDAGIPGLDVAFYKRRSVYHTKDDSVPTLGGKGSLWSMIEIAVVAGKSLAEDGNLNDSPDSIAPIFFDLFGEVLLVISFRTMTIINIVLLAVGPVLTLLLIVLASKNRKLYWGKQGWFRFPLSLVLSAGVSIGLAFLVAFINPYIVYSSPYLVLLAFVSAAFVFQYLPLRLLAHFRPIPRQKTIVLLELYIVSWLLLLFSTITITRFNLGAFYFLTFSNAGVFLSLLLALAEQFELRPVPAPPPAVDSNHNESDENNHTVEEATENTPLLSREETDGDRFLAEDEENQIILWAIQFLLVVPFSAILLLHLSLLLLGSTNQTLADGNAALPLYLTIAILSFLAISGFAPFMHKIHRSLTAIVVVILAVATLLLLFKFPFTQSSPLKVFFSQSIDLDTGVNAVNLIGLPSYLGRYIIPEIPSTGNESVNCTSSSIRPGLETCSWDGPAANTAAGHPADWLTVDIKSGEPGRAVIKIKGVDTRACRISFDRPVTNLHVIGSSPFFQELYPPPVTGLNALQLWSRIWEREFQVDVTWKGDAGLSGRVGCGWADIQSGKVPAFDEVISFLPNWSTVTKAGAALVEVTKGFSV
ncbi:hypothetical protein SISSUDRAFT_1040091 [Sistotremastrum suecicum HHB10207 ss-3]|uniref:Peptide hydrolase n=1 Tax=Sistotremastrum suecicum HHB10207 ss-3 TaxID=1314776 RepID=A0A166ICU4_9AGAM|nr:hypothetical protein SISSUDRAFT_1040091 [Sistotremastrum suecicum HHB10207 ss-3]